MGNINKDIERCKELIKIEHSNWIGMSNQDAISNVLKELEKEKTKNLELNIELKTFKQSNKNLLAKKSELETYKKIAEKLAEELSKHIWLNDKDAILKIYREKVEEDETYS